MGPWFESRPRSKDYNFAIMDIFLWWSIISTIIGLVFLGWDIWQLSASKKEKELHKAQVKIWQHHASGLVHGLINISQDTFSTAKDNQQATKALLASAHSLYTSLNEERLFTEKEIKEKQLKTEEEFKKARNITESGAINK